MTNGMGNLAPFMELPEVQIISCNGLCRHVSAGIKNVVSDRTFPGMGGAIAIAVPRPPPVFLVLLVLLVFLVLGTVPPAF